jgi:hypothetical protein
MSSDRGTMQRGLAPGVDQQGAWSEPTAPSGRRVPSAPRERRPALAALAVLLILGGALGAGFLVLQSGKRVAAIEISQQIGAGQQIPLIAMREVEIAAGTGLSYVPWNEASQVANYYAVSVIPPGTLLTNAMVGQASNLAAGKAVFGLSLKDGQIPAELQVGDHIDIYQVSDAPETCPGSSGSMLAANAVVLGITRPSSSSSSGAVACNSSNGIVGIAILPILGGAASGPAASGPAAQPSHSAAAQPSRTAQPNQTGTAATTPGGQTSSTPSPGTGTG